jgi:hypothetical protein
MSLGPFFLGAAMHAAQALLALHSHQSSRALLFASLMTSEAVAASRAMCEITLTLLNESGSHAGRTSASVSIFERAALKSMQSQSKGQGKKHGIIAQHQVSYVCSVAG